MSEKESFCKAADWTCQRILTMTTSRSLNPARLHGCSVFDATVAGRMEVMLRFVGSDSEATSLRITQDGSSDSSVYGYIKWEDLSTLAAVDGILFAAPATFQPASSSSTAIVTLGTAALKVE